MSFAEVRSVFTCPKQQCKPTTSDGLTARSKINMLISKYFLQNFDCNNCFNLNGLTLTPLVPSPPVFSSLTSCKKGGTLTFKLSSKMN